LRGEFASLAALIGDHEVVGGVARGGVKRRNEGGVPGELAGVAGDGGDDLLGNVGGTVGITRGPPECGAVDQLGVAMDVPGEGGARAGFCVATKERGVSFRVGSAS